MKKLPLGIQTFGKLIQGNYLYVDKTKDIYNLLSSGGQYYFLSRPRRFGKSVLVSTLKELFSGNKALFKGLWIYDKIEWKTYPVIHIDFLGLSFKTEDQLINALNYLIDQNAESHGVELKEKSYDTRFHELIFKLSQKGKVVALVDEYDKPIIDLVDNQEVAAANRDILKTFYSTLKGLDEYMKFVFITGVSKFSKVSVFSDLNNLDDITIDDRYATMLGYTHDELLHYFDDRLERLAGEKDSKAEWVEDIKKRYNGYSWDGKNFLYNPFSVLNFFNKKKFGNYWFESGSPSFLVKLIRKYNIDIMKLENYKTGEAVFSSFDIDRMHVVSLLFQTGYLTIKGIETPSRTKTFYYLSYPNSEVKEALLEYLLVDFSAQLAGEVSVIVDRLKENLEAGEEEKFFQVIRSVFAKIPYDIFVKDREGYYQTVIYLLLMLVGIRINTEVETNVGRIDAAIETESHIYVMEFKLGTAEAALNQVKEKKYYEKYLTSSKAIKLVGVGFDVENKNIGDYIVEDLQI